MTEGYVRSDATNHRRDPEDLRRNAVNKGHLETKVWQHHRHEDTGPNCESDFSYQSLGITFCDHGPTHGMRPATSIPRQTAPTIDQLSLDIFWGGGSPERYGGTAEYLEAVIGRRFTFYGFPLPVRGGYGSPVRALAMLDE